MMNDDARTVERLERLERLADHYERADHPNSAETIREGIELIKTKSAEIERLTLRWSSEKPTVAGVYLTRAKGTGSYGWNTKRLSVAHLKADAADATEWFAAREFAGPITVSEPEDRNQS